MTSKLKKIKFPKQTETLSTEQLEIEDYPDLLFTFWKNPSRPVVQSVWDMVMLDPTEIAGMEEHEVEKLENDYYRAISEIIVDTNIADLDLDTPEQVEDAFNRPDLPMGFLHAIVTSYLSYLIKYNDTVKKALALYVVVLDSGKGNAQKESELTPESSQTQSKS
jgi:hypothetical protein